MALKVVGHATAFPGRLGRESRWDTGAKKRSNRLEVWDGSIVFEGLDWVFNHTLFAACF
jgi:hypothetical protein